MKFAFSAVFLLLTLVLAELPIHEQHRIAKRGLNNLLNSIMTGLKIGPYSGRSGKVSYKLYNVVTTSFTTPHSTLKLKPNGDLKWSATGLGLGLSGVVSYRLHTWIPFADTVRFRTSVSGMDFSLTVRIKNGSVYGTGCSTSVRRVNFKVQGGFKAWIYNMFSGKAERKIKSLLESKLCSKVIKAVNRNSGTILAASRTLTGR